MGDAPGTMRTVSWGSSWSTVPTPTSTASQAARSACDTRRSASPLIHRASPVDVAIRPSSVCATLSTTWGLAGDLVTGPISSLTSTAGGRSSVESPTARPDGRTWPSRRSLVRK